MTARARAVETAPAEPSRESRRRADRMRSGVRQREPSPEKENTAAPRLDYSVNNIPANAPVQEQGVGAEPDTELPGFTPAPEPGVTAEQVAAREEQTAAAIASLENSQDSPGFVDAFVFAPPTVKAQVSSELGTRLSATMNKETSAISEGTPEIQVNMEGNTPESPGIIESPNTTDITLEPDTPSGEPEPESVVGEPVITEGAYASNDSVVNQLRNNFSSESGARDVDRALDNVQTSDPSITASPGTPPGLPLEGETDPQRFQNQSTEGGRQANETLAQQQAETQALPGVERVQLADVHETRTIEELTPPSVEEAPGPEGAQQYLALNEPPEVQTAFDQVAAAPMQQSLAEAQNQVVQAASDRDTQHQNEITNAQELTEKAQQQADADQRNHVAEAQRNISTERDSTLEKQQTAVNDMQQQAETRREEDRSQFDERTRTDQQEIDDRYTRAETDASQEIARGEREARAERDHAERESNDRSWWEAALDFIASVFSALVSAINRIFDAVRSAVNAILDAVRDFAIGLIRLAAAALKRLIEAFGDFLKWLVQGLLGNIFPGLARALMVAIDAAVDLANRAIDRVADALVAAVNAVVEALRAGIMALISIYQAAINAALSLARAVLTGDWSTFLLQLLEAACRVVGIDPQQIYQFIGRAQDTIQLIVNNPGLFFSNLLNSLLGGFRRFAENFITHLQSGIIGWLTGALGGAGITIPQRFDLIGVISLAGQVLGLTLQNLRQRIVRFVGERGAQVIEFVSGYVETLVQGGWSALWERIQGDLGSLRDMVFEQIRSFLVERIIMGAVTRLATLFNPVGALVNIVLAAYQFYTFIRDQLQRIMQVVTTIVDAISNIARSILAPAQERIEGFFANLLPLAIDLLARLIGLGNVGERVRQILQRVQDAIWRAIDRLIARVVRLFRGGGRRDATEGRGSEDARQAGVAQIGERISVPTTDGVHTLYIVTTGRDAQVMIESEPMTVAARIRDWRSRHSELSDTITPPETESRRAKALRLLSQAESELGQADQLADALAIQNVVEPRSGGSATTAASQSTPTDGTRPDRQRQIQVTQEERQLGEVLEQLFNVFGERLPEASQLVQRFRGNIAAAHPAVQEGLITVVHALELDILSDQSSNLYYRDWAMVRNDIERSDKGAQDGASFRSFVDRPLVVGARLAGEFPREATADIAVAGMRQVIKSTPALPSQEAVVPPNDSDIPAFVQGQKASIHDARLPYVRSVFAIRAVIWDARAQEQAKQTVGVELFQRAVNPSSRPGESNTEKIARYQLMYQAAGLTAPTAPTGTITNGQVDAYRREMRSMIVTRFTRPPPSVSELNQFLDRNDLWQGGSGTNAYNRIRGEIFEEWVQIVVYGVRSQRPVFTLPDGRRVDGDRVRGDKIVEAKAIERPRAPTGDEIAQMRDYKTIITATPPVKGYFAPTNRGQATPPITGVIYVFNRGSVAQLWISALTEHIGDDRVSVLVGNTLFDPDVHYTD